MLLQEALQEVYGGWWCDPQGFAAAGARPPRPSEGRQGLYPGVPITEPTWGEDQDAHFRWVLMFESSLYKLRAVSVTDIARQSQQSPATLRRVLSGVAYGKGETRVRATTALWQRLLMEDGLSVQWLLVWISQGGNWLPDGPLVPSLHLDPRGFVCVQHNCSHQDVFRPPVAAADTGLRKAAASGRVSGPGEGAVRG
ncbi:hypothetical protein [Nocardioides aestuarii]|uniref:Uncharacterized protein n=1 Tax=Nocardioides aestuarii TaxID=252231 RepID=A0ABW4TRK6_9ACTN